VKKKEVKVSERT